MREYLYQAKDTDIGKWVQGDLVTNGIDYETAIRINDKTSSEYGQIVRVDPETVREFTGVWEKNSKNGKRIFEGDIVAVPCDRRGNEYIGVVEFGEMPNGDDRYMGFYIKWDNPNIVGSVRCSMLWWRDTKDRYLKVIGNKWDNPELLKEKEPMLCTGDYCNKKDKCARYFRNADMSEPCQVESFASFGSGPAYIGKNGSHIIEDEVWCGPNGHYKMYKGDQQL